MVQNKLFLFLNDREIQSINSSSCGYFCIALIKFLYFKQNKFGAFDTFINLFSNDLEKNDGILQNMLNIKLT